MFSSLPRLLCLAAALNAMLVGSGNVFAADIAAPATARVQFDARASRMVENDSMRAILFVEVAHKTAAAASSEVMRVTNRALRMLQQDAALRVRTGAYRAYPVTERGKISGWRARSELVVESEDFVRVSSAIAAVSEHMQLSGVEFFVSQALRDEVETTLVDEAIAAFLQKAQRIANSFGATQFRVSEATVSDQGDVAPRPLMRAMSAEAASVAPEFSAGTTRLSATVSGAILIDR